MAVSVCPSRKYVLLDILDLFQNDVDLGLSLFLLVPTNNPIRCEYSETGPRNGEISKKGESENRV